MARSQVVEKEDSDNVGTRLRALRGSLGLSLRAAAARAGVTPGALSQIENGRSSPSVSTLKKILGALGLSLGEFFSPDQGRRATGFVFRAADLVPVVSSRGVRFLGLPGAASGRALQLMRETYAPGAGTGEESYTHEGEEGGFCLSGSIEITVAGRREILGPGDAYYYASNQPHRWRNIGRVPAVVISACTPPTF